MLDTRQIHSLTDFLRNHKAHLARLKETKTPEILTVNSRAELVIQDAESYPDFSVVLFRPNFMLVSEEHPMKTHKNQWLLNPLSPLDIPCGATNQGTHYGV